jgi:prophage tail gpP-like protein
VCSGLFSKSGVKKSDCSAGWWDMFALQQPAAKLAMPIQVQVQVQVQEKQKQKKHPQVLSFGYSVSPTGQTQSP